MGISYTKEAHLIHWLFTLSITIRRSDLRTHLIANMGIPLSRSNSLVAQEVLSVIHPARDI